MSLLAAFVVSVLGMAATASPAMAWSFNPEAGSPGIANFNDLHTILALIVVVAVVGINLWLLRAARGRSGRSNQESRPAPRQGAVVAALSLLALFIFVTSAALTHKGRETPESTGIVAELEQGEQLPILATGQQWLWRFNYPNGAFSYRRLVVPTGVTVALQLRSIDVVHGWNVPSLTGKAQAVPGRTNTIRFRADKEGTYDGRSSVLSGQGYSTMAIQVDAVAPAQYDSFIEQQKTDIQTAQDAVERSSSN
ncbi:MAG: cytochrome c oxidase subunit II [Solirubrobacterales bacterium]|nr:cytochrome c oxidase subunit II [Solirubrobacterales bacterium]